jgi:hypothetical protein
MYGADKGMIIKAAQKKKNYSQRAWITSVPDLLVFHSVLFYVPMKDTNKAFISQAV